MILEAAHFAASYVLTPRAFRPHLRSSISLWSRANRCASAWKTHEANCHRAILDAVGQLPSRRTCVVLGSGLLRDVPIEALARAFDTVILFDLVHLASVRLRLAGKRLSNVRLVHRDLAAGGDGPLAFLAGVPYLDLVISANLLSQIGIGAARELAKRAPELDDAARSAVIRPLLDAHVKGLAALPCPALLITDVAFDILDPTGTVMERVDLMHGLPMPQPDRAWSWPVAPQGEISKTYALSHAVTAHLYNAPRRRG